MVGVLDPATKALRQLISVVVPLYNEQDVIDVFHERASTVLSNLPLDSEIGR